MPSSLLIGLVFFVLNLAGSHQQGEHNSRLAPIDLSQPFAVTFEVRAVVDGRTYFASQIREQYYDKPKWASIELTKHNLNEAATRQTRYVFHAGQEFRRHRTDQTDERRWQAASTSSGLRLFDDGAERRSSSANNPVPQSGVELLDADKGETIERQLLEIIGQIIGLRELRLLDFIGESCDAISKTSDHLRGLSRALLLIDCRRDQFELEAANIYGAYNLEASQARASTGDSRFVEYLDVVVETESRSDLGQTHNRIKRIELRFAPKIIVHVDLVQFELLDTSDRLTASSYYYSSEFRLPLTSSDQLADKQAADLTIAGARQGGASRRAFAFVAHLTRTTKPPGSPEGPPLHLVELYLAYDGIEGLLARQVSLIERGQVVDEDTWRRHTTRTVFARETGLKYHIMRSKRAARSAGPDMHAGDRLANSCLVESLDDSESSLLLADSADHGYELLELNDAILMGTALVRGIQCKVYEKRLRRLPLWLAGSIDVGAHLEGREMYLTLYERSSGFGSSDGSIPIELTVDILSANDDGDDVGRRNSSRRTIEASYQLSVQQFSWSLGAQQRALLDISQDCLMPMRESGRARLDLQLNQVEGNTALASYELANDQSLREQLFSSLIAKLFGVAKLEQLNLEIEAESQRQFHLSATLYELRPSRKIDRRLVGYATSPSLAELAGQPMSLTLEECQLEAAHHLQLSFSSAWSGRGDTTTTTTRTHSGARPRAARDERSPQVSAIFCPSSLRCVLLLGSRPQQVRRTNEADPNRCSLIDVSLAAELEAYGESNLGAWKEKIDDAEQRAELIGAPIELRLDRTNGQRSFTMRLANIAMSRVQPK